MPVQTAEERLRDLETITARLKQDLASAKTQTGSIVPLDVVVGTTGDYTAPIGVKQVHTISLTNRVPSGARINAVWYVPWDNLDGIVGLQQIKLAIVNADTVSLTLQSNTDQRLAIYIHASYIPS